MATLNYLTPGVVKAVKIDDSARSTLRTDGYGTTPTRYMVKLFDSNRWRRVYSICYGNGSTMFVNFSGEHWIPDPYVSDILANLVTGLNANQE